MLKKWEIEKNMKMEFREMVQRKKQTKEKFMQRRFKWGEEESEEGMDQHDEYPTLTQNPTSLYNFDSPDNCTERYQSALHQIGKAAKKVKNWQNEFKNAKLNKIAKLDYKYRAQGFNEYKSQNRSIKNIEQILGTYT